MAALGMAMVLVTATPLVSWISVQLAGPWTDPHGDVLVVLAGSSLPDGMIGLSSYWRCVYAARVFREGGFQRVFITGGGPAGETPIAVSMRQLMVVFGVPADVIDVEPSAISTRENALRSVPTLVRMPGRKVLLTSDYHMFRSRRVFQKAGLDLPGWPFPDTGKRAATWDGRWPAFLDVSLELLKIVDYKINGWI